LATSSRPAFGHGEHADLVRAAEPVLGGAQDAILMAALAFEAQHGIDHMFEHARARDGAILGDVTDQDERATALLGETDQLLRRCPHLADGAGCALDQVRMHRSGSNR
jgi:hypothetical protein